MDWGPMLVRTVDLGYEQMLMIETHPRQRIKVVYGGVWLTEEGVLQDAWLSNGDEVALKSRGMALLEGIGAARIQLLEEPRQPGFIARTLSSAFSRVLHAARALRTRLQFGPREAACETC